MRILMLAAVVVGVATSPAGAQSVRPVIGAIHKEPLVANHAKGSFDVKIKPLAAYDTMPGSTLGRMSIDKQFHGDLEGTSIGEMLVGGTDVKNSAGYVAIERVTGKLNGRSGSFTLQHSATMNRGAPHLLITVISDSGTGELVGLTGTLSIEITNGNHFYDFSYTLPGTP
jgi:hypothetical protein